MAEQAKARDPKRRRRSALASWSRLLLTLALLRVLLALLDWWPRAMLGDGWFSLGTMASLGLVLTALAVITDVGAGLLSFLARLPARGLLGFCHAVVFVLFPPLWLLDRMQTPEVVFRIATDLPAYALTIDDGIDPATTPVILDKLRKYESRATFFVFGRSVSEHPELVQRILDEGHELANHQMDESPAMTLSDLEMTQQIRGAQDLLKSQTNPRWFRPGGGYVHEAAKPVCRELRMRIALATVFPFDSHIPSARFSTVYLTARTDPGDIVVLHDGGERGLRTAAVLDEALPILKRQGLSAVTLSELSGGDL